MPYSKNQNISSELQSFRRLPAYVRADIINHANSMGVDYISLYQTEQRRILDIPIPSALSFPQNLDNCTDDAQNADHMPFMEGADEMLKRQKIKINGQEKWIKFGSTQELIDLVQKELQAVEQQKSSPTLVSEYMLNWFETYKRPALDQGTAAGQISLIKKHILPVIGNKQLNDVCVADVQKIVSGLQSASMAKKAKSAVNQCFAAAIADELYKHPNPAADKRIVMPTKATKRTPLEKDDLAILMDAFPTLEPEHARLLAILVMTGCRRSEALAVHWEDINWEKKSIHLQHALRFRNNQPEISDKMKTKSANRTVALWDSLIPYLGEPQNSGLIIHSNGKPLTERQYNIRWKAIQSKLAEAGLKERFTAHQLRHTFATVAANSGSIPVKVLQGLMGHANFQTTMNTYASLDTDQMLTSSSIISDKYTQLSEKSCSKNCSA